MSPYHLAASSHLVIFEAVWTSNMPVELLQIQSKPTSSSFKEQCLAIKPLSNHQHILSMPLPIFLDSPMVFPLMRAIGLPLTLVKLLNRQNNED
jgi:hypothetical protein